MIRIGVTGHRILTEIEKLEQGIDIGFSRIERSFPGPFTLISSLAEGADQLVAQRALDRWHDCQLIVPLPLPISAYQANFTTPESLANFNHLISTANEILPPPQTDDLPKAYLLTGQSMLERIDILIAVWDGQPAQGIGGTGNLVELARRIGIPLVWVHAGNRQPGTEIPTSLGAEQGQVSFEGI